MVDERTRELAKFLAGMPCDVEDKGSHGILRGVIVEKNGNYVEHAGDRFTVLRGMIFRNGRHVGHMNEC